MIRIVGVHRDEGLRHDLPPSDLARLLGDEAWRLWVDLERPNEGEVAVLRDVFGFHPLAIDDCHSRRHHPKLEEYSGYLFLILHGVDPEAHIQDFRTRQLSLFLGPRYLVTFHRTKLRSTDDVWDGLVRNDGALLRSGPDFLMHAIVDSQVDRYLPILDRFEIEIEQLEDRIFHEPSEKFIDEILALKKALLRLRRISGHQRAVLQRLVRGDIGLIQERCVLYLRDVLDHMTRVTDLAEAFRDMAGSALDAYVSTVTMQLNQTMKVLTAYAVIFIPLTFVAGVWGMNFSSMPELHWKYGYYLALGAMGILGAALYLYFRRKRFI
jgi:magnesium transporter